MDWYSWLSKTNLDPSNIYEYSVAFARNELQEDDLAYFNHEFLQSLGVSIAKHRLEILKLARKRQAKVNGLMKIVESVNKSIARSFFAIKLAPFHKRSSPEYQLTPFNNQWNGALKRISNDQDYYKRGSAGGGKINTTWSGPLRPSSQEIITNKAAMVETNRRRSSPTLSGPLYNGKVMHSPGENGGAKERIRQVKCRRSQTLKEFEERVDGFFHDHRRRSSESKASGGSDNDTLVPSLWSLMFQDMKPT